MAVKPVFENQGPAPTPAQPQGGFVEQNASLPADKSHPNPYAPYEISDTYTGTYVGVPDNYYATAGYTEPYMGPGYGMGGGSLYGGDPILRGGTDMYTIDYVHSFRGRVSDPEVYKMQQDLYNHGYLSAADWKQAGTYDRATELAFGRATGEANFEGLTLQEMYAKSDAGMKGLPSSKKPDTGPKAHDYVSKSLHVTSRAGAQQVLTSALAQELGREPTDAEVTRFLHSLNAQQRANPSVTRTHVTASGDSTSTTMESSVEPSAEAQTFARSGPFQQERHKYQDALYFDVLSNMLGGGG